MPHVRGQFTADRELTGQRIGDVARQLAYAFTAWIDDAGDAVDTRAQHVAARLDGPHPTHVVMLAGAVATGEPGVVGDVDEHGSAIAHQVGAQDRKSTRLNSSHVAISYAVFCLKKKNKTSTTERY